MKSGTETSKYADDFENFTPTLSEGIRASFSSFCNVLKKILKLANFKIKI